MYNAVYVWQTRHSHSWTLMCEYILNFIWIKMAGLKLVFDVLQIKPSLYFFEDTLPITLYWRRHIHWRCVCMKKAPTVWWWLAVNINVSSQGHSQWYVNLNLSKVFFRRLQHPRTSLNTPTVLLSFWLMSCENQPFKTKSSLG